MHTSFNGHGLDRNFRPLSIGQRHSFHGRDRDRSHFFHGGLHQTGQAGFVSGQLDLVAVMAGVAGQKLQGGTQLHVLIAKAPLDQIQCFFAQGLGQNLPVLGQLQLSQFQPHQGHRGIFTAQPLGALVQHSFEASFRFFVAGSLQIELGQP